MRPAACSSRCSLASRAATPTPPRRELSHNHLLHSKLYPNLSPLLSEVGMDARFRCYPRQALPSLAIESARSS